MTDKQIIEQAKQIIREKINKNQTDAIIDFLNIGNLLNVKNIKIAIIRRYYHDQLKKNGYRGMDALTDTSIYFDVPESYVSYCVYQFLNCAI